MIGSLTFVESCCSLLVRLLLLLESGLEPFGLGLELLNFGLCFEKLSLVSSQGAEKVSLPGWTHEDQRHRREARTTNQTLIATVSQELTDIELNDVDAGRLNEIAEGLRSSQDAWRLPMEIFDACVITAKAFQSTKSKKICFSRILRRMCNLIHIHIR